MDTFWHRRILIRLHNWLSERRHRGSIAGPNTDPTARSDSDSATEYQRANLASVADVLLGIGPDDRVPTDGAGARIVFNISCAHIPTFCERSIRRETRPYQNAYDVDRQQYFPNIASAGRPLTRREAVDKAIEYATGLKGPSIYFGAVETSGTGVRFYGDMCLVLSSMPSSIADSAEVTPSAAASGYFLLDRNSYDIVRQPAYFAILSEMKRDGKSFCAAAGNHLKQWLGMLPDDLVRMGTDKVKNELSNNRRRWTTGAIAEAILYDEDYLEALCSKSFGTDDLLEVRVSASDAAAESDIANRERAGEASALNELQWRQQRREARRALSQVSVLVRVVTTPGRLRTS